ncbi:MAG: Asp-tRNA(Asn)/Glu-tRNA(Gln) amidotransferase subunit GatC [Alcanivoracaceae bacterium]|nr:Asp-tRNA(Asn)/Glu-tRNA(Gln) amidotransferase subunit GatC [Alcanivoracaceae bacterium]
MAIDQDTVLKVAHLARLHVSAEQSQALAGRLSDILNMVDQLQQAEVDNIAPLAHPLDVSQPLREDVVQPADLRDRVLPLAPASEGSCFLVPRVIE